MKKPTKTDYEKGRSDGLCLLESRYPKNANYLLGYASGLTQGLAEAKEAKEAKEARLYLGSNDAEPEYL